MIDPKFVHLRLHTDYSIIDGLASPYKIIKKASDLKMVALGITDVNNLFGVLKFYKSALQHGIKPILGVDFYINSHLFKDKLIKITLLASTYQGYKNLIILTTKAHEKRFITKKIFIKRDWLKEYNSGLIVLSGGYSSDIGTCLLNNNINLAYKYVEFYLKYFPSSFYLEISRIGRLNEEKYLINAVKFAVAKKIPVVATNEVCFLEKDDLHAHKIRIAINKSWTLYDVNFLYKYTSKQFLRSEQEMCKLFKDIPQALKNSVEIAKRCNVILSFKKYFLPHFNTGNITADDFLAIKSKEGLKNRLETFYPNKYNSINFSSKYYDRLNIELSVIKKMGFSSYFLVVMEFIQWAKDHNISVGPGRGSGAGSLVAFSLKITELDPIVFDLLFERFLNPERINLPDFDVDFCMEKRDLVIEHVEMLYGKQAVSQIITFGRMTAKAVIRDVGRVLGYPYGFINRISKLVPMDPGITLEKAFSVQPELENFYIKDEGVKLLIDTAKKLEGVVRNVGKHAGGVIIVPNKVTDFSPLYFDEEGKNPVTQFDKDDIEMIGLVKFDFLGLKTLTIIQKTISAIKMKCFSHKKNQLNINMIPLTDKKIFEELKASNTTAIFQLESVGMRNLIRRLKPDSFEDLLASVALFRPGPLQSGMVDNFVNRKHGKESIYYPDKQWQHKLLKPILKSTYGIILYQEQVMKIAQILSGYTLGAADILRRAMAKKNPSEMSKQRSIFQEGAKKQGINNKLSVKIFDLLEKFAGYGFNKSHSAAYALISYQTLWLKVNYTSEFMAEAMTADMDNTDRLYILVQECIRMNLKVFSPNINNSMYAFKAFNNNSIIYGMGAIKGLGKSAIDSIIKSRDRDGKFRDLFDLCIRINLTKLNRRMIDKLIMSGAFDCFEHNRASLMCKVDSTIKSAMQYIKTNINRQKNLFGDLIQELEQVRNIKYSNIESWSDRTFLENEKLALGFYLTGHPLDQYIKELKYYTNNLRLRDIISIDFVNVISVFGMVVSVRHKITKNKEKMILLMIDDKTSILEVIIFNTKVIKDVNLLEKDKILILKGRLVNDKLTNKVKLIAHSIVDIETYRQQHLNKIIIELFFEKINDRFFDKFEKLLKKFRKGNIPVYVHYNNLNIKTVFRLGNQWKVITSNDFLERLKSLVKPGKIILKFKKKYNNRSY